MINEICSTAIKISPYRRVLIAISFLLGTAPAFAELMLYPTRIVIEGNQRSAQIQLINNGTESRTYRIGLVNRRMNETGSFIDINEPLPGELFADDMLRFSPRQVTLAPGTGQTVRVMVRKPSNLPAGEYRSHLLFSQQPETSGHNSVETRKDRNKGIGERSVYGDLAVTFTPQGGPETVIARANGVAVYSPNLVRRARLALKSPSEKPLANGVLRVTYQEPAEAGGKLLAEAALQVH